LSNTALISSGLTTPRPDVTTMARPTSPTLRRYGANVEMTRRIVCLPIGRASVSVGIPKKRPCPLMPLRIRAVGDALFPD
jgi:hypothetical protein